MNAEKDWIDLGIERIQDISPAARPCSRGGRSRGTAPACSATNVVVAATEDGRSLPVQCRRPAVGCPPYASKRQAADREDGLSLPVQETNRRSSSLLPIGAGAWKGWKTTNWCVQATETGTNARSIAYKQDPVDHAYISYTKRNIKKTSN